MALETRTDVEKVTTVQREDGAEVPPASDDYRHVYETGADLSAATYTETVQAPDRADTLTLHVEGWTTTGEVYVHFLDPDGNRLTSRGPGDNGSFGTDGSSDVFVDVAIAAPLVEIEVSGTDTVNITGYVR
jgi:catechol 2,3-dioxygenase-like lactoylglutathione lyase family enzyme